MNDIEKQIREALEPLIKEQAHRLKLMADKHCAERHIESGQVALVLQPKLSFTVKVIPQCTSILTSQTSQN